MTDPRSPLLLSMDEAAACLGGISRATLKIMLANKVIPSVKVGRRRMITRAALEAYVAALEQEQAAASS